MSDVLFKLVQVVFAKSVQIEPKDMTQEHTDKKEILDTSQYNHKTKLKTNAAICPHYDNLSNGNDFSLVQKRSSITNSMDTPLRTRSTGVTPISTDSVGALGSRRYPNRSRLTKKTDVDGSIQKLKKLKDEIASKLNEVKGVLNKYDNDNTEQTKPKVRGAINRYDSDTTELIKPIVRGVLSRYDSEITERTEPRVNKYDNDHTEHPKDNKYDDNSEQSNSKSEPVKFRFVRRVRRKSSLLDDIEKAPSLRVTEISDPKVPIDLKDADTSDKRKVDDTQLGELRTANEISSITVDKKDTNSAIEKVQFENITKPSESSIPSEDVRKAKCEEQNTITCKIDSEVTEQIAVNEKSEESKIKLEPENVVKKPAVIRKRIVKRPKSNKANMIVDNSESPENRRRSIAITEPSSLKNSMNLIPFSERRLSDSIAITASNVENEFVMDIKSEQNLTIPDPSVATSAEKTASEKESNLKVKTVSEITPPDQADQKKDIGLEDTASTKHFIDNHENINLEEKLEPIAEALNTPSSQILENKVSNEPIKLKDIAVVPVTIDVSEKVGSPELQNISENLSLPDSKALQENTEKELPTSTNLVQISSDPVEKVDDSTKATVDVPESKSLKKEDAELSIIKDLVAASSSSDATDKEDKAIMTVVSEIPKERQATPGKIVRRKTPKIRKELAKPAIDITEDEPSPAETEATNEIIENSKYQISFLYNSVFINYLFGFPSSRTSLILPCYSIRDRV